MAAVVAPRDALQQLHRLWHQTSTRFRCEGEEGGPMSGRYVVILLMFLPRPRDGHSVGSTGSSPTAVRGCQWVRHDDVSQQVSHNARRSFQVGSVLVEPAECLCDSVFGSVQVAVRVGKFISNEREDHTQSNQNQR